MYLQDMGKASKGILRLLTPSPPKGKFRCFLIMNEEGTSAKNEHGNPRGVVLSDERLRESLVNGEFMRVCKRKVRKYRMSEQTKINIKYGLIGFVSLGVVLGFMFGMFTYFIFRSIPFPFAAMTNKDALNLAIFSGLVMSPFFGIAGIFTGLNDAPIVVEENKKI